MKIFYSLLLLGFPLAISGECASGWVGIADYCYRFYQERVTWSDAKTNCEANGDFMPEVLNRNQYDGILAHMNANYPGQYWTSGKTQTGSWIWATGGGNVNSAWFGRTPSTANNKCLYFCSYTNKYWDRSCSATFRYFCQNYQILDDDDIEAA